MRYWKTSFECRVGFLYGYFAEDPGFDQGIRAVVEAIYEPPQRGDYKGFTLLDDHYATQVRIDPLSSDTNFTG